MARPELLEQYLRPVVGWSHDPVQADQLPPASMNGTGEQRDAEADDDAKRVADAVAPDRAEPHRPGWPQPAERERAIVCAGRRPDVDERTARPCRLLQGHRGDQ